MLTSYQQRARLILSDPAFARFNDFDLRDFCNTARGQIAGEAECVRVYGSVSLVPNQRSYPFGSFTLPGAGVAAVNTLRTLWYNVASGQIWVQTREWEWFSLYYLNNPVPGTGPPAVWSQLGQGQFGTVFVDPVPDLPYICPLDLACAPAALNTDADPEAIPPLWQDAVPYFAAYLAALTIGDKDKSDHFMSLYQMFMERARAAATSSILPGQAAQGPDPVALNRLGLSPAPGRRGGGGAAEAA